MTNITALNLLILAQKERQIERERKKKRKKGREKERQQCRLCAADVLSHWYAYKDPPYSKEALSCQHTQLHPTENTLACTRRNRQ